MFFFGYYISGIVDSISGIRGYIFFTPPPPRMGKAAAGY